MTVHYYGIANCDFNYLNGAPVIVAPPDTDSERLSQTRFEQQPDGRWVHFLTEDEYDHINHSSDPAVFGQLPASQSFISLLELLVVISQYAALIVPLILFAVKVPDIIAWLTGIAILIAGLIILIVLRVRYPARSSMKGILVYILSAVLCFWGVFFGSMCIKCSQCYLSCANGENPSCQGKCSTSNPGSSGTSETEQLDTPKS